MRRSVVCVVRRDRFGALLVPSRHWDHWRLTISPAYRTDPRGLRDTIAAKHNSVVARGASERTERRQRARERDGRGGVTRCASALFCRAADPRTATRRRALAAKSAVRSRSCTRVPVVCSREKPEKLDRPPALPDAAFASSFRKRRRRISGIRIPIRFPFDVKTHHGKRWRADLVAESIAVATRRQTNHLREGVLRRGSGDEIDFRNIGTLGGDRARVRRKDRRFHERLAFSAKGFTFEGKLWHRPSLPYFTLVSTLTEHIRCDVKHIGSGVTSGNRVMT